MGPDDRCDLLVAAGLALAAAGYAGRSTAAGATALAEQLDTAANELQSLAAGEAPTATHQPTPPTPPQPAPAPARAQPPRRR